MAGHSKFANIKHKKAKNDARKGKIFTKLGREIAVSVKLGGSDPEINSRLRDAIATAKSENMPNDTIDRSIKKAAGDLDGVNFENIFYEGYGPNGVAVMVEALTDNRNRSAGNIRSAFTKGGGNLGSTGCVSYMFNKLGQIMIEKNDSLSEDSLMMIALDAGANDFNSEEEGFEIITDPDNFTLVREAFEKEKIQMISAIVTYLPDTYTELNGEEDLKKMNKLLYLLEEDDDVQNIYHNWDE